MPIAMAKLFARMSAGKRGNKTSSNYVCSVIIILFDHIMKKCEADLQFPTSRATSTLYIVFNIVPTCILHTILAVFSRPTRPKDCIHPVWRVQILGCSPSDRPPNLKI